jgi:IS605 OrfB family transposase
VRCNAVQCGAMRCSAVQLLARAHLKVQRQRADFHHKTALALVRANDTIDHEDVQTANMLKNHHRAKSISDAGWSAFLSILAFQAADAGKRVVAVPPAYTSQRCSGPAVFGASGVRGQRCSGPAVFGARLWRHGAERPVRSVACVPGLWHEPAPGPQRRQDQRAARAEPSGRGCLGSPREPSISRIYAGECQLPKNAECCQWRHPSA